MISRIDRWTRRLEEQPIGPATFLAAFTAVVLARHLLEILVGQNPVYFPIQFFIHYPLAYLAPFLALVLILHLASGVPIERVSRLMLYVWGLTLLPPLIDLLAGRSGEAIGYLRLRFTSPGTVFLRFFDPTARFEGTTPGIRVETAVACLLGAAYVWMRRRAGAPKPWAVRLIRPLGAAAGVYVAALGFFTLPLLFTALAAPVLGVSPDALQMAPRYLQIPAPAAVLAGDRLAILYLVPLCLAFGAVWLGRSSIRFPARQLARSDLFWPALAPVLAGAGLLLSAFAHGRMAGAPPPPAPLDLLAGAGLLLACALATWGSSLAGGAAAGASRPVAAVLIGAGLALALGCGFVAPTLLAVACGLLLVRRLPPLCLDRREPVGALAAGLAGVALVGAGMSWGVQQDALALFPPRLVAAIFLATAGAAAGRRLRPRARAAFLWGAAAVAVPGLAGAPAAVTLLCLLTALLVHLARRLAGRRWPRAEAAALVAILALGLAGVLMPAAPREQLLQDVFSRPKRVIRHAQALEAAGRYQEAVAAYRRALDLDPDQARVQARLGELLWRRLDDPAGGEKAFRAAIDLDPEEVPPRQQLGILVRQDGRVEEAARILAAAARLAPADPVVWRSYAVTLTRLPGRRRDAAAAWRHYLEVSQGRGGEEPFRAEALSRLRALQETEEPGESGSSTD